MRNKFEEKTEIFQEYSNFNYKKCLEYLFYGVDPKVPNEINYIIEDGFRTPKVSILFFFNDKECEKLGI